MITGFALSVGLCVLYLYHFADTNGPNASIVEVEITQGLSPRQIATLLEKSGVISNSTAFYYYLRFLANASSLPKAGDYEFQPSQTPAEIIDILQKGRVKEIRLTIPEGSSKVAIAQIMENAGFGKSSEILMQMDDPMLLSDFGIPAPGPKEAPILGGIEGYLFPDTYFFPKKTSPAKILRRLHERLLEVITQELKAKMQEAHLTLHEVLTLASIIEKETGVFGERPRIASVFFNRLTLGMKLQTDPTVVYTIKDFLGNITKQDLMNDHPYNTYIHQGLPPGPIASPGLLAIRAVLWPETTNFLYFVSKNDGSHVFCPNLKCHEKAVKFWQLDFRKRKPAQNASAQ